MLCSPVIYRLYDMFHKSFYSTLCNIFKAFIAVGVASVNGIIQAIRKHIAGNGITRVCAGIGIRIDKPVILRIIISALQIIEPRLGIIIISAIPERVDLGQITLRGDYLAPRGIDILCLQNTAFVNDLDNVTLQIENIVICIGSAAFRRVVECKRAAGLIIEEVEGRGIHRGRDSFPDDLAALGQIFMRHGLSRGKRPVGLRQILLCNIRIVLRGRIRIRLDRLPRPVLQRNKDQWEIDFCLVQGVTSYSLSVGQTC